MGVHAHRPTLSGNPLLQQGLEDEGQVGSFLLCLLDWARTACWFAFPLLGYAWEVHSGSKGHQPQSAQGAEAPG